MLMLMLMLMLMIMHDHVQVHAHAHAHAHTHAACSYLSFSILGTRVEDAKAIFATSDLHILAVDNLEEAAKMVYLANPIFVHCSYM